MRAGTLQFLCPLKITYHFFRTSKSVATRLMEIIGLCFAVYHKLIKVRINLYFLKLPPHPPLTLYFLFYDMWSHLFQSYLNQTSMVM
jgi:hypothetical protein